MNPRFYHKPLLYSPTYGRDFLYPPKKIILIPRTSTERSELEEAIEKHKFSASNGNTLATLFPHSLAINHLCFVPSQYFRKTGIKLQHFGNTFPPLPGNQHFMFCSIAIFSKNRHQKGTLWQHLSRFGLNFWQHSLQPNNQHYRIAALSYYRIHILY